MLYCNEEGRDWVRHCERNRCRWEDTAELDVPWKIDNRTVSQEATNGEEDWQLPREEGQ